MDRIHHEGQHVLVDCNHQGKIQQHRGIVEGVVAAMDRPYRLNVRPLDMPGRYWRECAPECVHPVIL